MTRILRAHDNRLTEFPAALATLTELEELRVDGNRLRGLPDSLKTMTKVRIKAPTQSAVIRYRFSNDWPCATVGCLLTVDSCSYFCTKTVGCLSCDKVRCLPLGCEQYVCEVQLVL